jgi:hypothetical protein
MACSIPGISGLTAFALTFPGIFSGVRSLPALPGFTWTFSLKGDRPLMALPKGITVIVFELTSKLKTGLFLSIAQSLR